MVSPMMILNYKGGTWLRGRRSQRPYQICQKASKQAPKQASLFINGSQ
jgi:hypothetical protein